MSIQFEREAFCISDEWGNFWSAAVGEVVVLHLAQKMVYKQLLAVPVQLASK